MAQIFLKLKKSGGNKLKDKIGILLENRFIDQEIIYYKNRFKEENIDVIFFTRLWGQQKLIFTGIELGMKMEVENSFETLTESEINNFKAFIFPAGYVSDYLLYSEDSKQISPAAKFTENIMNNKNILKGFICHSLWIASPVKKVFENRKVTCHNNIISIVENSGMKYIDTDIYIDDDIITARTGNDFAIFSKTIIESIKKRGECNV